MEASHASTNSLQFSIPLPTRARGVTSHRSSAVTPEVSDTSTASLRFAIPVQPSASAVTPEVPDTSTASLRFTIPVQPSASRANSRPLSTCPSSLLSDGELAALDAADSLPTPDTDRVDQIAGLVAAKLALLERVQPCAVCEMAFGPDEVIQVPLSDLLLRAMRLHLTPRSADHVPQRVLRQYDASSIDARLSGVLLYPPGLSTKTPTRLWLCETCHDCLNKRSPTLPRMAVANGNYIGWYEGEGLTWLDEQMVALVSACVSMTSIAGGRQRCIRSHHYIVKNTEGPPVTMLPTNAPDLIRVALVGAMTPEQVIKCKRRYTVNVPRCRDALDFLCREHASYKTSTVQERGRARLANAHGINVIVDGTEGSTDPVDKRDVDDMEDTASYSIPDSTSSPTPDPEIEALWIEERTVLLDDSAQSSDFFFRKSNVFEPSRRWECVVEMFPLLFPHGRGGPKEPRKQQYGLHTWVKRCLRLHGNRFEKHEVFLLLAFDYLAQESARKQMFIRLKTSTDAAAAGKVTQSVLKECVEYRQHLEDAAAKGVRPNPPSDAISSILKLQRGIYAGQVGYYGSDKSRTHGRNDIFGYIGRLGPLQLFFTISPDSAGTYAIGLRSELLKPEDITRANAHLLPTRTTRRSTATSHPFQCAVYFDKIMSIVIEDILGWNKTHRRPKRRGGIFGVVRAFAASAETQVSGDLHAHFAVWLYGFPTSATATEEAMKDPEFRDAISAYVDRISTTTLPGVTESCPDSSCEGKIKPVELSDLAYQKPKRGARPCTVAICTECNTEYGSHQLLDTVIRADMTAAEADYIQCRAPSQGELPNEELNVILRSVQIHRWYHSKSCFKSTRTNPTGSYCRFQRPVPPNLGGTFVNDAQEVVHHRPLGSEYVNPYNKALAELFRCNHDLRLVLSSTSKDVAAYICKYVMKPQNRIENETALALATYEHAVKSTNARVNPAEVTDQQKGNSVFCSWLYHVTNKQDIAASLAGLFVLRESAFWFSHPVIRIHLQQLLATFDTPGDQETTVQVSPEVVERDTPIYEYVNALQNYWKRPSAMEELCLVDVLEGFELKAGSYNKLETRRVMVICGKAFPDMDICLDLEEQRRYYKSLVMLFKPSRRHDRLPSSPSFRDEYEDFLATGPPCAVNLAREYVRRLEDSHTATRASNEADACTRSHTQSQYSSTSGLIPSRAEPDFDDEEPTGYGASEPIPIPTFDRQIARYDQLLQTDAHVSAVMQNTARQQLAGFNQTEHRVFIGPTHRPSDTLNHSGAVQGTTDFLHTYCTRASQLRRLEAYMNPIPWTDPSTLTHLQPETLPDFAPKEDVSRAFRLNLLQHAAFETIARHVLYAYANDIADEARFQLPVPPPSSGIKRQLIGFLGGEAGTGKSQVIHALLRFATLWRREGSIEALAYTGVAAININGRTVHNARNIPVDSRKQSNVSEEMTSKFRKVVLTICDEISMMPQTLLGRAGAATSELVSPTLKEPWGGRHLLFCGDWMQLPPVQARPCYLKPSTRHSAKTKLGYDLYALINFVVFLTENMRNRFDPTYTGIISRVRWGRCTDEDIALLNSRVGKDPVSDNSSAWYFHPAIVATNEQRCAINYRMTFETAASHGVQLFECSATPTTSRSVPTLARVQHLDDSCTDRIPFKLLYFFGMPVMLSQRSRPNEQATANGTVAFIAGHELKDETNPGALQERNGCNVVVLRDAPKRLILHIPATTTKFHAELPPGHLFIERVTKSIQVEIPHSAPKNPRASKRARLNPLSLSVRQFAIVPAFACTPERLQGRTCHDGVTLFRLARASLPTQALYVALSRTTSLDKLVLVHPLDAAFLDNFKPDSDAVHEIHRLLSLIRVPAYFTRLQRSQLQDWIKSQSTTHSVPPL